MTIDWYTFYNPETGAILGNLTASNLEYAELNKPDNTSIILGQYSSKEYYIDSYGIPQLKPNIPNYDFVTFDRSTNSWLKDTEAAWANIRQKRNALLLDSDWTDTASAVTRLGSEYQLWQTYRQALRDMTSQQDPFTAVWPIKPGDTKPVYKPIKFINPIIPQQLPTTQI